MPHISNCLVINDALQFIFPCHLNHLSSLNGIGKKSCIYCLNCCYSNCLVLNIAMYFTLPCNLSLHMFGYMMKSFFLLLLFSLNMFSLFKKWMFRHLEIYHTFCYASSSTSYLLYMNFNYKWILITNEF